MAYLDSVQTRLASLRQSPAGMILQSAIETLGHEYAAQDALVTERAHFLREEAAQVEGEIRSLKTGDRETGYEAAHPHRRE